MGNFSVNHYAKITLAQRSIELRYLIDMAEIPAFQEMRQFGIAPSAEDPSAARYLQTEGPLLQKGITLESDGQPVPLEIASRKISFAEGAGGLVTMKVEVVFRGKLDAPGVHKLSYGDVNFPGRAGWKEVVVTGRGVSILNSSAPATDRSKELTEYSSDVLNSPPQQTSASVEFEMSPAAPGGTKTLTAAPLKPAHEIAAVPPPVRQTPPVQPAVPRVAPVITAPPALPRGGQNTPRNRFTELISTSGELSFWILFTAAFIAAGLGALHALEPGHGKTIVAAYLVGSRGTAKHAVLLGLVVTIAHTAGVFMLGVAILYASRYIVPEHLYPWLGAISGLSVAGIGIFIFLRHWTGESGAHSHVPGEQHSHWFGSLFGSRSSDAPNPAAVAGNSERALSLRELLMLGVTGGIVPCPAALVVLLSAFSLHRIGFGLFLITAFSIGLASVLVVVGLAMVYAKRAVSSRVTSESPVLRYLPFLSSACMVVLGVGIALSALAPVQLWQGLPTSDRLLPFLTVIVLGLFLGIRHSTDPDHVVAVSTIVSRQGSIRSSATIGLLWGLGHTLTIFLVGSAIIIFGVVIPPRLGLSMEFCVALMLILLGVLNLTGVMAWITKRTAPVRNVVPAPAPVRTRRSARLFDATVGSLGLYQTLRPLAVGLVHGLAGSAAVALLVLSTIKSPLWSTAYLLVFGFGTMLGMMLMTAAISMPLVYTGKKFSKINQYLIATSGFASVAFGLFLVYQIGFVDGLFTSHVRWVPQ